MNYQKYIHLAKTVKFEQIRVFLRQAQELNIVTVAERSKSNPRGNSFDGRQYLC